MTHVGFSTPKAFNPVSWLVRKFTGAACSHAWFLYYDKDWGFDVVLEAHELGFRLLPYEHFKRQNNIIALFIPKMDIDVGLARVAKEFLGRAYDFGGLLGMSVVLLGRFLKRKWRNPFQSSKAAFCSEACVLALLYSDFPQAEHLLPHETSPQDLMNFFEDMLAKSKDKLVHRAV